MATAPWDDDPTFWNRPVVEVDDALRQYAIDVLGMDSESEALEVWVDERINRYLDEPLTCEDDGHDWGAVERSRFAGTPVRRCQRDCCGFITLDLDLSTTAKEG